MKKLLYSLTAVVLGLASCNSWDDEHTQNYGDGPAVSIDLTTTTDLAFTFTVTPGEETQYYSYAVVEGSEAQEISSSSLLKNTIDGTIAGAIVKYSDNASVTVDMHDSKNQPLCQPNTSYVVYAIAANDKGVTGEVSSIVVKTTDGDAPVVDEWEDRNDVATVSFSENVTRGTGTVTAKYYKEWDILNPVDIAEDNIDIAVEGNTVAFSVSGVPAGAYVIYSWAEGAFVDSFGNECPAMNSGLNMSTGQFTGIYSHLANVSWDISDEGFAPASGSLVADYRAFTGTITFDKDVYRNDYEAKDGDITVIYTGAKKTTSIALSADDWSVSGNTVVFHLPEAASAGDIITIKINKDVIFDVYGNGNNEYVSTSGTVWWKYFAMTKEMALGNFKFSYISAYDESSSEVDGGTFTIVEDPEEENGLIFKNLYLDGSEIPGRYDLGSGKIYVYAYYGLGVISASGANYGLITYSLSGTDEIVFTVNPDGTITSSDFGIVACDENYQEVLSWWEKCSTATFTPAANSAKARAARKSHALSNVRKANVRVNARSLGKISK